MPYSRQINAIPGGSKDVQLLLSQLNRLQNETDRRLTTLLKRIDALEQGTMLYQQRAATLEQQLTALEQRVSTLEGN